MIRPALFIIAVGLIVLAIMPLVRADSLLRAGHRAWPEILRFLLAIAAASGLLLVLWRTR